MFLFPQHMLKNNENIETNPFHATIPFLYLLIIFSEDMEIEH